MAEEGKAAAPAPFDEETRQTVQKIPLLRVRAGPRDDAALWRNRLKEELLALIQVRALARVARRVRCPEVGRVFTR